MRIYAPVQTDNRDKQTSLASASLIPSPPTGRRRGDHMTTRVCVRARHSIQDSPRGPVPSRGHTLQASLAIPLIPSKKIIFGGPTTPRGSCLQERRRGREPKKEPAPGKSRVMSDRVSFSSLISHAGICPGCCSLIMTRDGQHGPFSMQDEYVPAPQPLST